MDGTAPRWFTIAAIAAILFEAFGVANFVADVMRTPAQVAQLPIDQQILWSATPSWLYVVYGIATLGGLAGALGLLLRRLWSIPLLGLSLLGVIVQFGAYLFLPRLRVLQPPGAMLMPAFIIVVCALIYALAHLAHRRGWLR